MLYIWIYIWFLLHYMFLFYFNFFAVQELWRKVWLICINIMPLSKKEILKIRFIFAAKYNSYIFFFLHFGVDQFLTCFVSFLVTVWTMFPPVQSCTFLCWSSSVKNLNGPSDVQVKEGDSSGSLPLAFLLQRLQEGLHIDVRPSTDPATQLQGQTALLAVVPRYIGLPVWTRPAAPCLCSAWERDISLEASSDRYHEADWGI